MKTLSNFLQRIRRGANFTSLNMFRTTTFNIQGECLNPAMKGGTWTEASYHVAFFIMLEECVNNLFMTSTDTGRGCLRTSHLSVFSNLIHMEVFRLNAVTSPVPQRCVFAKQHGCAQHAPKGWKPSQ